ncbi:MAG TPA: PSD1 and planctomycete cytochrome C domain-containing protein [Blastocatellia bacterium]|jgi:mono/diheme cytochrome c family protein|nr:PSD1 and planctomycete cytochrome C domain-containing protein [Blastocatellia bacterium]
MKSRQPASRQRWLKVSLLLAAPVASLASNVFSAAEPVRFGRDVLPILSANCFACHGPDEKNRKAGLRLDLEANAKATRRRGAPIAPGEPEKSLIIARLTSADPDVVMPPPSAHRQVKPEQIETLRRWIAEGAKWGRHWSFEPLRKPVIASERRPVDALVSAALAKKGLALRAPAAPQTLTRRLWLDLIGLPPTPEIADKFAADRSPAAYERMVDELLKKPQFGEHWARMWLDLARYADTKGYEKDRGRTMWPYRDWVVNALNADMPLDRFTTEQLAGDLLPNPTQQQLIATAFHRNTMSNDEGGTDDEEFRVAAVKDRVDTTAQVWMGLTMGCAKCHTHKYDPISQAEYYSFYALFNQTEDADRYDDAPTMEVLSPADQDERTRLQALVQTLSGKLTSLEEAADRDYEAEGRKWRVAEVVEAVSKGGATLTAQKDGVVTVSGKAPQEDTYIVTLEGAEGTHTALRFEALPEKLSSGELAVGRNGADPNFVLSELTVESLDETLWRPLKLTGARADFAQDGKPIAAAIDGDEKTGWAVGPRTRERHAALFNFADPLRLKTSAKLRVTLSQQAGEVLTLRRFRLSTSDADPAVLQPRADAQEIRKLRDDLAGAYQAQKNFNENIVRLPLMRELAPDKRRETKIHRRGNFLDQGDPVTPGVPAAFHNFPDGAPLNRLGLAQWLVSRDNPLTPRVWANRIWARLFGIGVVETEEDFGAQGSAPANPDLLDWLAAEYRDNGWSLKKLIKTIVMSDTYRQASEITPALRDADPRNLIQSRGARFRLSAEVVRDQALAVGGLLSAKMGGPPVMPPQPAGLWRSTYSGKTWVDAEGEDRFRRGLYTYLKRTTPYPSMVTFDGGSGEVCQIRRIRTNTPLQALVTLNDPVYLEAAAGLARRMIEEAETTTSRAAHGLRLALIRPLRKGETAPLIALQKEAQKAFEAAPEKADALLKSSRATEPKGVSKSAFAAWIVTASAILNLDEFLSRN